MKEAQWDATEEFAALRPAQYCGMAYNIVGNAYDAEDCVQEAFLQAWTHLDQYRQQGSLRSWVASIVANACFRLIRRRRWTVGVDFLERLPSPQLGPERLYATLEAVAVVEREIGKLPAPYQKAILERIQLFDEEDETEAAQQFNCTPAWKSRLYRARNELAARMVRPMSRPGIRRAHRSKGYSKGS